jgi:hypothetical protein
MKRMVQLLACLFLFGAVSISILPAEDQAPPPWLWVGPRIGISGEISKPSDFDDRIQEFFPKSRKYFPVYSEIGLAVEQRIRIGDSGYQLFLQQRILVGGLDQPGGEKRWGGDCSGYGLYIGLELLHFR